MSADLLERGAGDSRSSSESVGAGDVQPRSNTDGLPKVAVAAAAPPPAAAAAPAAPPTRPQPRTTGSGWLTDLFPSCWKEFLGEQTMIEALLEVEKRLVAKNESFQPPRADVFNAYWSVRPQDVKVVFLALDPAPQPGLPNGLALSAPAGKKYGRSITYFMNEWVDYLNSLEDKQHKLPDHADLLCWARKGVLLLNTYLTVKTKGESCSHADVWSSCVPVGSNGEKMDFTSFVLKTIAEKNPHVVFVALGDKAILATAALRSQATVHTRSWVVRTSEEEKRIRKLKIEWLNTYIKGGCGSTMQKSLFACLSPDLQRDLEFCGAGAGARIRTGSISSLATRLHDECAALLQERKELQSTATTPDTTQQKKVATLPTYWLTDIIHDPIKKHLQKTLVDCLPPALRDEVEGEELVGKTVTQTSMRLPVFTRLQEECENLLKTKKTIVAAATAEDRASDKKHLLLMGGHPRFGWGVPGCFAEANAFLSSRGDNPAEIDWGIVTKEEAKRNWSQFIGPPIAAAENN